MTAPAPVSGQVRSADGTALVFDRSGEGPAVILVHGAFTDRTHPLVEDVAAHLAPWFTVFNFDRRGRGASGDTSPYAVEREIEDLSALIHAAGGTAMVFGGSSGAGLAARAASGLAAVTALALWEPPYHVDDSAPYVPDDFGAQLDRLVAAGRPGDAVARFMTEAAEVPADTVAAMRAEPSWRELEALAHTLGREAAVMGPGNALPALALHVARGVENGAQRGAIEIGQIEEVPGGGHDVRPKLWWRRGRERQRPGRPSSASARQHRGAARPP